MALNNTSKVEERESCHAHGIHKKTKCHENENKIVKLQKITRKVVSSYK